VSKHGNHYSVIGIKHITQKASRLMRRQNNQTCTNWYSWLVQLGNIYE